MSELGDWADVILAVVGFVGMLYLLLSLGLWLTIVIVVCGCAVLIRDAHVHVPGVFAGSVAICIHTTGPVFAIAGGCSIHRLQGFVIDA